MSMYNALFGKNEETPALLGMIGVNEEYFARFRDVKLVKDGTIIKVLTRLGGGNREYYTDVWEKIQSNELYVKDYDDDYDCTYAFVEFSIPDKFKDTAKKMFKGEPISFKEKWEEQFKEMKKPGTEAYKKSQEVVNKILKEINNDDGNHIIKI